MINSSIVTSPRVPAVLFSTFTIILVGILIGAQPGLVELSLWLVFAAACGYSISGSV